MPVTPYLAPDLGFEALKDAAALIRCLAAGDGEGLNSITSGNSCPPRLATAVAVIAVGFCRRGGLDNAGIDALLADISAEVGDFLLDQEAPGEGGEQPSPTA